MYRKLLILLVFPLLLTACGSDEPGHNDLVKLQIDTNGDDIDVVLANYSAEIGINGKANNIVVELIGDFDSFNISADVPNWMSVSASDHRICIAVSEFYGDDIRSGKIVYTVFKGSVSESGTIIINQRPLTSQELQEKEYRAIQNYIKAFSVINEIPEAKNIKSGSDAPYYKLDVDGMVYMQVVSKGDGEVPSYGDNIYFRFDRYNLIFFMENGYLGGSSGNASDITTYPTSFILNDEDSPYGSAIQMPMLMRLPLGSEVNLVVGSDLGFTNEISNFTPYLYKVRYYSNGEIASTPVYLAFNKSEWMTFGVISVGVRRFFNKDQSLPVNFQYKDTFATGLGGVLLFGGVGGEPYAYEAACPYEVSASCVVDIEQNSIMEMEAVCPKCNSHFDVLKGNGVPLSGPAYQRGVSLKKYRVSKAADGGFVITN